MNYQKIFILGNIATDAETKISKKGSVSYTRFRVAVSEKQHPPVFFSVTVFGSYGESVSPLITKGRQIFVEGRIEISDKGYFSVIADRIEVGKKPENKGVAQPEQPSPTPQPDAAEIF